MLDLAYMTGMRLAELAAAELGWLRCEQLDDGVWAWSIMVLGKRRKWLRGATAGRGDRCAATLPSDA